MFQRKQFTIPFVGLKQGSHLFNYGIENSFFESFGFNEFNSCLLKVELVFEKKATFFELMFSVKGYVNVNCDLSLEPYEQEVKGILPLIVKFGPIYSNENDEILTIPYESYQIDISQYIYELIILSVPAKKIHPKVLDGSIRSKALDKLRELEINENRSSHSKDQTDPRWDTLKSLLTEKNI